MVTSPAKWEVDAEGDASGFDAGHYGKLLEERGTRLPLCSNTLRG